MARAIALTDAHRELAGVVRSFLTNYKAREASRALLDSPGEELPSFWPELARLGWLGLHLPEAQGGSGYGLAELVVVLDDRAPSMMMSARLCSKGRSRRASP